MNEEIFSENEIYSLQDSIKIKKQWLIALGLMWLMCSLDTCYKSWIAFPNTDITLLVLSFPFCLILGAIPFWFIYYCAYKKNGTKLLIFQLIFGPLTMLSNIFKDLESGIKIGDEILGLIIVLPIIIFSWISSYRLYKLNSSIKNKQVVNNQDSL